jgi:HEAT repeat protein
MTAEDIDELFAKTLAGDYEDDAAWQAVHELRRIGSLEVFTRAAELCKSDDPLVRARGIDVLAQLGKTADHPNNSFPEESYSIVSDLLQKERDIRPLGAAIVALGHLDNPLAIPMITEFGSHPSADIRFDVAFALGCFPNDPRSMGALLALMEDADEDVRDWATFGLGVQGDLDSEEIRDALFRRLSDSNEEVREEAMEGLGKRRDQRVVPSLIAALERPPVTDRVIEATYQILDMKSKREDWGTGEYAAALRERFGT